ncbi:MAG: oligosaccharide flippase family protein [Bacteroidales bacterium]|nr:oligosaccharide flippase family protein [Bacteroidales bacterium]
MANPIKQLVGETAIYGLSTILARVVNFLLVPLYSRVLTQSQYGSVTYFLAFIAVLQVVLTLGLETGCFRYSQKEGKNPDSVFSTAFMAVLLLCSLFLLVVTVWSRDIADALQYTGYGKIIVYVGVILLLDSVTAILFARLRAEHKAIKFAVVRTLKIFTEVGVNLLLYLVLPRYVATHPGAFILNFVSASPDFTYAIFAIMASCVVCTVLLVPEILRLSFRIDLGLAKELLLYSLPLMLAGLPGVMNDFVDRFMLSELIPGGEEVWRAQLGVYQAGVKIAVIMSLFVQMFRYAAEPFFFQRERDKGSKELYAKVMTWFVAFCMAGFLFVMLYMDAIGLVLGRDFREGLSITPIMLVAYIMLGMQFNISMWYKLSGKTGYAVWITLAGLVVTVVINLVFIPRYSYHAAAWAHVASYAVMMAISLWLGGKYYPIPYNWPRILLCVAAAFAVYGCSLLLPELHFWPKMAVHTALLLGYAAPVGYYLYRKN